MFQPPPVDQDDVLWVSRVLGLPDSAFTGADGTDPRAQVLLSNETLDVEACPGSGKTTLLVAKLAILARKWQERRSGICVLSHTNAARREIERCLGKTEVGAKLLSYPHFVGTIHGFINEFLAMPWLRSLGYQVTVIDDAYCEKHRRRLLLQNRYRSLSVHVAQREQNPRINDVKVWQVANSDFLVHGNGGIPFFQDLNSRSARQLAALARQCAEDGYFRYDEMFMWAEDLLANVPGVAQTIRQRFPMLFIDEVQDNSEPQSRLLQKIFLEGDGAVLRQRFGDSNQAIYGHAQARGAQSDPFPVAEVLRDIPDSHRFGQQIADLADPLALRPQNLRGRGPSVRTIATDVQDQNTVFLFSDASVTNVLDAYASHLTDLFSEQELRDGTFTAVGAVHRKDQDDNLPRFVGHYWPDYDYELSYAEPRPNTFHQYIASGWNAAGDNGEVHVVVERLAEAILRVVQITNPAARIGIRKRKHRFIKDAINDDAELSALYGALVIRFVDDTSEVTPDEWRDTWSPAVILLAGKIGEMAINIADVQNFLEWPAPAQGQNVPHRVKRRDNYYRYPVQTPRVSIRVGSIHSVKGETHTATLVLDTFFHAHQFSALRPWLTGERVGQGREGPRIQERLKQHYVAFTRPTHLLCLAMRDELSDDHIQSLLNRSWRIARVRPDGNVDWL